jgi:hypothetical protein
MTDRLGVVVYQYTNSRRLPAYTRDPAMNATVQALTTRSTHSCPAPLRLAAPPSSRRIHRARDFGVGYGNSSGYASCKRYTPLWAQARFQFG